MDPELLKQRQVFLKHAAAVPVVEKKAPAPKNEAKGGPPKVKKKRKLKPIKQKALNTG